MINFGIVYGISAFGLSENLEIPREQAQEYIDAYLARFPLVQDFIQRTIEQAKRDGYATSLLGRRRPTPEIRASNRATRSLGERLAVNFVMQGSNADIIKKAMIAIHRRLRDEGRGGWAGGSPNGLGRREHASERGGDNGAARSQSRHAADHLGRRDAWRESDEHRALRELRSELARPGAVGASVRRRDTRRSDSRRPHIHRSGHDPVRGDTGHSPRRLRRLRR